MRDLSQYTWIDHPDNPLIEPPRPEPMIADPTVLDPARTCDGRWHLYTNSVAFIRHYTSEDGVHWSKIDGRCFQGIRPFLFEENGTYYLLYERHLSLWRSGIALRQSTDLHTWDKPRMLIIASRRTDGGFMRFLGNPCMIRIGDTYRLYFSYDWVFLRDCFYPEPKYVGYASASSIQWPFIRHPDPLIRPDPADRYRSMGAGSVKLLPDGNGGWWVFNNGVYRDQEGHSRGAILLLHSRDGLAFEQAVSDPIVAPEPGWKRAFVYACDPVWHGDEVRLYYNARDGWFRGKERIGLAYGRP